MTSTMLSAYAEWTRIGGYRADAEYYRPEHIAFVAALQNVPHKKLGALAKMRRPQYRTTTAFNPGMISGGIKFLSPTDVAGGCVDWSGVKEIDPQVWNDYPAGQATEGDLLLEVKGDATKVFLICSDTPKKAMVSGSFQQLLPAAQPMQP